MYNIIHNKREARLKATEKQQELCDAEALASKSLEEALCEQELTLGPMVFGRFLVGFCKFFAVLARFLEGFHMISARSGWPRKAEVFTEAQKCLQSREEELIEAQKQADAAEPARVTLVEKRSPSIFMHVHAFSSCF